MRAVRIADLTVGEEVYAQMRLGLALEYGQRGDGSIYARVPDKPQKVRHLSYTRWQGIIIRNNTTEGVLTCQITATNSLMKPVNRETVSLVADVHYSAFQRLRVLSKINFEPRQENYTFPANFEDTKFKPYRTFTEVILPNPITGV